MCCDICRRDIYDICGRCYDICCRFCCCCGQIPFSPKLDFNDLDNRGVIRVASDADRQPSSHPNDDDQSSRPRQVPRVYEQGDALGRRLRRPTRAARKEQELELSRHRDLGALDRQEYPYPNLTGLIKTEFQKPNCRPESQLGAVGRLGDNGLSSVLLCIYYYVAHLSWISAGCDTPETWSKIQRWEVPQDTALRLAEDVCVLERRGLWSIHRPYEMLSIIVIEHNYFTLVDLA